ncbi:MAG: hypothetical protein J7L03_00540 [Caldisericaceae bacterium]|nr:hypothetical protein [Caldisericaceae bacterium]
MSVIRYLSQFSTLLSFITVICTFITVICTIMITKETKRMREIQTIPKLHIDAEPKGSILNLVIRNIGVPPAHDVKIVRVNPPIDYFEMAKERLTVNEKVIIKNGKSVLYSGEKIVFPLLSADDKNFQEEINKTLEIEVFFLDINGLKHIEERRINLKEFRDILIEGKEAEKAFFI